MGGQGSVTAGSRSRPASAWRRAGLILLALGPIIFWSASFPITKLTLNGLGPMSIAFLRWTISTLALAGWLVAARRMPQAVHLVRREARTVAWVALTGITLYYALQNLALRYTTALNAGILTNLCSVFLFAMGALWLHERVGVRGWLAMLVAFVGAVLVSLGSGHLAISSAGLAGDLMMVVASLFAALYSIGGKGLTTRYPADVVTTVIAATGALLLLPLALWEGLNLALPADVWVGLLILGVGSGALANLFWLHLLSYTEAARAGMILFLVPVASTILSVWILHEPFSPGMLVGGVLILGSMAAIETRRA
jgi:drug/metabolite transporter (DMT)-like permease